MFSSIWGCFSSHFPLNSLFPWLVFSVPCHKLRVLIKGFVIFWPVMETKPHWKLLPYPPRVIQQGSSSLLGARECAVCPQGLNHMENAIYHAAIWRGWGGSALRESRVHDYSPSLPHREIHSAVVRVCFCRFAEYGLLLLPLGIRVKRSLLGWHLMHILNDGFCKPLENWLQRKLKDQDTVISPSGHLTKTIFRS